MEDAIQAKPKDPDLYLILAALYEKENQSEKALAVIQRGLEQNREDTDLQFQMGAIYDKLGNFEKAVAQMKEVLRLKPDLPMPSTIWVTLMPKRGSTFKKPSG